MCVYVFFISIVSGGWWQDPHHPNRHHHYYYDHQYFKKIVKAFFSFLFIKKLNEKGENEVGKILSFHGKPLAVIETNCGALNEGEICLICPRYHVNHNYTELRTVGKFSFRKYSSVGVKKKTQRMLQDVACFYIIHAVIT